MPLYDFKCERCCDVKTMYFLSFEDAERTSVWCDNPNCKPVVAGATCRMFRLPSAAAFTVKGYSAKNGYSKEQS